MKKGFTLIELLVVVLIIGILAAIALPQYEKAVEKSRMIEGIITVRKLVEAQELFKLANGRWATLAEIDALDISLASNSTMEGSRPVLKYFYCTNQGTDNEVNCQRLPGNRYFIYVVQADPYRLHCSAYDDASTAQKQLCNQLESTGSL